MLQLFTKADRRQALRTAHKCAARFVSAPQQQQQYFTRKCSPGMILRQDYIQRCCNMLCVQATDAQGVEETQCCAMFILPRCIQLSSTLIFTLLYFIHSYLCDVLCLQFAALGGCLCSLQQLHVVFFAFCYLCERRVFLHYFERVLIAFRFDFALCFRNVNYSSASGQVVVDM